MRTLAPFIALACLAACGSSALDLRDAGSADAAASDAGEDRGDAGPPDGGGDAGAGDAGALAQRIAAAQGTAANNANCAAIAPFYWEVGDVSGAQASGSQGSNLYTADTSIEIASASKLFWGAYVVERFKSDLGAIDFKAMTMRSGYVGFNDCPTAATVQDCFDAGTNATYTPADDGLFDYNGGHFQKYAIDLSLGPDTVDQLAAEYQTYLGAELPIAFKYPQLAGGMKISASGYAQFLRKILAGGLAISNHLGEGAVCTLPAACPSEAVYSPASPERWHYSYGHWVEDDPTDGDGAFSSPGKFGFYPWIDASKTSYGVISRLSLEPLAYMKSALCGRAIRKAYLTGVAQ